MWDLPGPGLELVFPESAGGFLTTAPPGKPLESLLKCEVLFVIVEKEQKLYLLTFSYAFKQKFAMGDKGGDNHSEVTDFILAASGSVQSSTVSSSCYS